MDVTGAAGRAALDTFSRVDPWASLKAASLAAGLSAASLAIMRPPFVMEGYDEESRGGRLSAPHVLGWAAVAAAASASPFV